MRKSIPMPDFWKSCGEADRPPRRLIGMSFRLGIPWQVALQQSLPPLSQPEPSCNDTEWSVEEFSADGTCLTDSVSQKSPQSTFFFGSRNRRPYSILLPCTHEN